MPDLPAIRAILPELWGEARAELGARCAELVRSGDPLDLEREPALVARLATLALYTLAAGAMADAAATRHN